MIVEITKQKIGYVAEYLAGVIFATPDGRVFIDEGAT
jgi:hypothetical protein